MTEQDKKQGFSRTEVIDIIRSVRDVMEQDEHKYVDVFRDLEELVHYIEKMKQEIAAIHPAEIPDKHIPTATDELDAVVGATEEATGAIMDACEAIETIGQNAGGDTATQLTDAVTRIYEACSFQDITGQRITKVVGALKHIEDKVQHILSAMGSHEDGAAASGDAPGVSEDAKLLNGPATPGSTGHVDQDEIDRLLAGFDD